jgi:hypothetical protein
MVIQNTCSSLEALALNRNGSLRTTSNVHPPDETILPLDGKVDTRAN